MTLALPAILPVRVTAIVTEPASSLTLWDAELNCSDMGCVGAGVGVGVGVGVGFGVGVGVGVGVGRALGRPGRTLVGVGVGLGMGVGVGVGVGVGAGATEPCAAKSALTSTPTSLPSVPAFLKGLPDVNR